MKRRQDLKEPKAAALTSQKTEHILVWIFIDWPECQLGKKYWVVNRAQKKRDENIY
mgnify:CR=1 FL=1